MKNLFIVFTVVVLSPKLVFSDEALNYSYAKNMYGDLNIGYATCSVSEKGFFYLGGRAELSFMNWENEYRDGTNKYLGHDKFDFKPMLGLDLFTGYKFTRDFRADIEFGYMGEYSESEFGVDMDGYPYHEEFRFNTYFLTANAYYNIRYGLYAGAGFGTAISRMAIKNSVFGRKSKTSLSPLGAFMLGWVKELAKNTDLDIRYRLSVFDGGSMVVNASDGNAIKIQMGYVMDNSISAGVRCYF